MNMDRILVAHRSPDVRREISVKLSRVDGVEIVSKVRSESDFFEQVRKKDPDVVAIGMRFKNLSGLDLIKKLMATDPKPVLVITEEDNRETVKSFSYGALDFISPEDSPADIEALIDGASGVSNFDWVKVDPDIEAAKGDSGKILAVGGSTGGPGSLQTILESLPRDFPAPVVVAQHMSGQHTQNFASRLDRLCSIEVRHASTGDSVESGKAYISPGDRDMSLQGEGQEISIDLREPSKGDSPSIDRLFESVAECYGKEAVGVVLSGMGNDGAVGARYLSSSSGTLIVQDEKTSTVYGIGKHVVNQGDADHVLPIDKIPEQVARCI